MADTAAPPAPPAAAPSTEDAGLNISAAARKASGPAAPKSTAMQKSLSALRAKAGEAPRGQHGPPPVDRPSEATFGDRPTEPPKDVTVAPVEAPKTDEPPPADAKPKEGDKPPEKPPEKAPDGKKQPISKFIDHLKATAKNLETENAALKAKLTAMGDMEAVHKRMEAAEKRKAELEEEIRFVNYAKSQEFVEKYQQPYEEAWSKAVADLKELPITLEGGGTRPATADDMLLIANMPLGKARETANAMFGEFADDVMAHYRRIRDLAGAQQKALENAKKAGADREAELKTTGSRIAQEIGQLWESTLAEDVSKHDFLKPKEGDTDWNSRLERATEFVDDAWKSNAGDPKLTPEQRAEAVRRHAAIRNRAIGFSMLRAENKKLAADLAAVRKELDGIKGSAPGAGNGRPASAAQATATSPLEAARQRLHALAK